MCNSGTAMSNACIHKEQIDRVTHIGTCTKCGQVRQYDGDLRKPPEIIKEGGVVAMTAPNGISKQPDSHIKPDNWRGWANWQKHAWYQDHKEQILADVDAMGIPKARQKWDICSATMSRLCKMWGVAPAAPAKEKVTSAGEANGIRPSIKRIYGPWGSVELALDVDILALSSSELEWLIGLVRLFAEYPEDPQN